MLDFVVMQMSKVNIKNGYLAPRCVARVRKLTPSPWNVTRMGSCRKVERGSQQTPYYNIFFEAVFGKAICTNARMRPGRKAFYFTFANHSHLSFGSWVNLKVLTLDFEWFTSKIHCEIETRTISNFPHFLSSPK